MVTVQLLVERVLPSGRFRASFTSGSGTGGISSLRIATLMNRFCIPSSRLLNFLMALLFLFGIGTIFG